MEFLCAAIELLNCSLARCWFDDFFEVKVHAPFVFNCAKNISQTMGKTALKLISDAHVLKLRL